MKKSAVKFLSLGLLAFLIDYGFTLIFHYLMHIPGYLASAISFTVSFIVSFTLSSRWVFRSQAGFRYKYTTRTQTLLYLLLAVVNLIISSGIIAYLGTVNLEVYISKAIAVALVASWNFFLGHYFIFSKKEDINATSA